MQDFGGPMIAKLFAGMMHLEDYVRPFYIIDYKVPFNDFSKSEEVDKQTFEYTNNYIPRQERQTDIFEFFK